MNITSSNVTINLYKYKLDATQLQSQTTENVKQSTLWIPIFEFILPIDTWSDTLYLNNSGYIDVTSVLQGTLLPFWCYIEGDTPITDAITSHYKDDFFSVDYVSQGTTRFQQTWECKIYDSDNTVLSDIKTTLGDLSPTKNAFFAGFMALGILRRPNGKILNSGAQFFMMTKSPDNIGIKPEAYIQKGTGSLVNFSFPGYGWQNYNLSTTFQKRIDDLLKKSTPIIIDPDDPNSNGGHSTPNGGGGPSDIGGDTNSDDGLPTISALDSGLLTAYNPTVGELQSLGKFLWSDSFDVNSFKKLFNDPFDTLLGLSIVPIKPTTIASRNIMFGNLDSGVSAPVVSDQWVSKDMGSVVLNEVWKGALDYSPSTSASIYLPYIGMRQLNINDVMGSTIHLIYKFDVLTGTCIAQLYVNHDHMGNKDDGFDWNPDQGLLYEFMGQCSVNIPLASQDFTNTIRSAISAVGMVAGASASIATGNPVLGVATATVASANLGMQANTPTVERSGHLSSAGSLLGYYRPFLVVTRPHQCKPKRYYSLRGVPSQVYADKLSNCTGFTQITANNNIHVSGAEDSELAEIQNLLVSGVYFPDKKR